MILDRKFSLRSFDLVRIMGGMQRDKMERINLLVTRPQMRSLRSIERDSGLTVSEILRRALDEFIERRNEKVQEGRPS
jgi:hypothetical protein